jgi:hypothetical protein
MLKRIVTLVHGAMGCQFTAHSLLAEAQLLHNARLLLVKYTQAFLQAVLKLRLFALQLLLKKPSLVLQTLVEQKSQNKKLKAVAMEQLPNLHGNCIQILAY